MENRFRPEKYLDLTIVDNKKQVVCTLRIKPSSILWKDKHAKMWKGVSLRRFSEFMNQDGKDQKK